MNGELIDGAQVDAFVMGADQVEAVQIALRSIKPRTSVRNDTGGIPYADTGRPGEANLASLSGTDDDREGAR